MKTKKIFLLMLIFLFATVACEKEEEKKDAPVIPPESTFLMNFSDFASADTSKSFDGSKSIESYINWGHSYFNVAFWNLFITVGLAIPVASFVESFNHEAIYHPDDNNWTWSYNFNAGGIHEAELTGYIESDTVIWEMRIDNFLWYYGHSHLNRTGGYWILNESQNQPTELLKIDWNRESEDVADIKYINIKPDGAENGRYIFYGKTTDELNRFYDIYNKGADNLTEIEWLTTDKHGRVKDFNKFCDDLWHCWDSTLVDVDCGK